MKRRLLIAVIFLLAGAVVNVGVAWGCAIAHGSVAETVWGVAEACQYRWRSGPYWSEFEWFERVPRQSAAKYIIVDRRCFGLSQAGVCNDTRSVPISGMLLPFAIRTNAGFPVRSFRSEWFRSPDESEPPLDLPTVRLVLQGRGAAAITAWVINDALRVSTDHTVPLRPIWPGLLFNTFVYATIFWLFICGPFTLRRFLRLRRGLCPKCAYPMDQSAVCTECGRDLPKRVTPAT